MHPRYTLWIESLEVPTRIGVLMHERSAPQSVIIDAQIELSATEHTFKSEAIDQVLDYRQVRELLREHCLQAEHTELLETLLSQLAQAIEALPGVVGFQIKLTKPQAFDDCNVALSIQGGSLA